jgi:hypothetical protein
MNRIITICAAVLMTASIFAQTPEKISYQAVIRNSADELVTNTEVGMQISILQGSILEVVYQETQASTTNANGLVSLEIGTGTTSDYFSFINWANGPYFIKTETDPSGGTNYSITATSQLMSVPYALYAKTSENGITAEQTTAIETNTAKVGVKKGSTAGEMQYWNGTDWVSVAPGKEGQMLSYSQGVPTWKTFADYTDIMSSTGQIWMDRNLGASQVASSSTDADAYGDLYQWGRGADGHQKRTSGTTSGPVTSGNEGNNFITISSSPYDWLENQDDDRWNTGTESAPIKTANDPCPSGYRVPTEAEWQAELDNGITNAQSAFEILKLQRAGSRSNGSLSNVGNIGYYWSSTVNNNNSRYLYFSSIGSGMSTLQRVLGFSVRCLKD